MRSRFRTVLVAMVAVLALGAVAASAAQAEEAPFFKVAGARLGAGESQEVKGASSAGDGDIIININEGNSAIVCSMTLGSGAKLLGSNAGEPGIAEMTIKFSECTTVDDGSECKAEVVAVTTIKARLVDLESAKKGPLAVLLYPAKGAKFLKLKFKSCLRDEEETLEGDIAASLLRSGVGVEEVGKELAEAKTLEFKFPEKPITTVWEVRGGVGSKVHVELTSDPLRDVPDEVQDGSIKLELVDGFNWGVFT